MNVTGTPLCQLHHLPSSGDAHASMRASRILVQAWPSGPVLHPCLTISQMTCDFSFSGADPGRPDEYRNGADVGVQDARLSNPPLENLAEKIRVVYCFPERRDF